MRFRILTIIILSCLVLLGVKAAGLIQKGRSIAEEIFFPPLVAEEKKEEQNKEEEKKDDPHEKSGNGDKEGKTDKKDEKSSSAPTQEQRLSEFNKTEIDILQQLARRHQKLKEWEDDLKARENVYSLTQARIDQKLGELKVLKQEVEAILEQYNQKEDKKIMTLVKVYENMKPKNAAQIFSESKKEDLVQIMAKMKEVKLAAVLGQMDPKKAEELTREYSMYGKLSKNNLTQVE